MIVVVVCVCRGMPFYRKTLVIMVRSQRAYLLSSRHVGAPVLSRGGGCRVIPVISILIRRGLAIRKPDDDDVPPGVMPVAKLRRQ